MKDKVAIVTGASRGIGEGIARRLAREGYNLVLVSIKSGELLYPLAKELSETYGKTCIAALGDISEESFVSELKGQAKILGSPDVLINNAGIWRGGLVTDLSLRDWNELIAVNLTGTFLMCREFVPMMLKEKKGCIINMSSIWGIKGASCESAYSATKGGINAFTQALAMELAPSGIRVNAIAPGVIDTDMNAGYTPEERKMLLSDIPLGRFGTPQDVAEAVMGIINSNYMTGQIIPLEGGFL